MIVLGFVVCEGQEWEEGVLDMGWFDWITAPLE